MYKTIGLAVLSLILMSGCSGGPTAQSQNGFTDNVKKVSMVTYSTVEKFGELEKSKFISRTELFFDNGKVVRQNNYDSPVVVSSVSKHVYDGNANLDSISIYDSTGGLEYKLYVKRFGEGNELDHKRELYNSAGELRLYYDFYLNDDDSSREKQIAYQKRGEEFVKISQSELIFNQYNQALSEHRVEFDLQGVVVSSIRKQHDYDDFTLLKSITYALSDDEEKVVSEVSRTYNSKDEHGNPLVIFKSTIEGEKETTEIIELSYEYI